MKKLAFCALTLLVISACSPAEQKPNPVKGEAVDPAKPLGVPSSVYKKVKTIESDHNAALEKTLKEME